MKAPDFDYQCPQSLADALAFLSDHTLDCQVLAGGQSLLPMMHLGLAKPDVVVDINKLSELDFIEYDESHARIGAMTRYAKLFNSEQVREHIPLLWHALPSIAHSAIRNRGTVGGSAALADPAAEFPAILLALNATVVVVSKNAKREIPASEFFLGIYTTALEPGELIHSFHVPLATPTQRFGFYELARRHGDYAMAGVAICAQAVEPYSDLSIAFFAVGEVAIRASSVEAALNNTMNHDASAIETALDSLSAIEFYEDANASPAMKRHLAGVVLQRALRQLHKEAG